MAINFILAFLAILSEVNCLPENNQNIPNCADKFRAAFQNHCAQLTKIKRSDNEFKAASIGRTSNPTEVELTTDTPNVLHKTQNPEGSVAEQQHSVNQYGAVLKERVLVAKFNEGATLDDAYQRHYQQLTTNEMARYIQELKILDRFYFPPREEHDSIEGNRKSRKDVNEELYEECCSRSWMCYEILFYELPSLRCTVY